MMFFELALQEPSKLVKLGKKRFKQSKCRKQFVSNLQFARVSKTHWGNIRVILGLYGDNGTENSNYYSVFQRCALFCVS